MRKKVRIVGEKFSALLRLLQNVESCIFSLTILYYLPNLYFFLCMVLLWLIQLSLQHIGTRVKYPLVKK